MSYPRPPRRDTIPRPTIPLRDLALDDRERAYYGPRTGDWMLLGLMVVILLGNGAYIWHQTGLGSHVGRAAFFGLLLLCLLWAALVYTFKLSVCVRVGPQGLSVVRGPWRTELLWREVARLTERAQMLQGQRYRWLVALARDGRKMQIRDDMVDDYGSFRIEVYERYRLWRDHGGTWGTTGGGPYAAKEMLAGQTYWTAVGAVALALPAVYFLILLPETDPAGWILLVLAAGCALASVRGMLRRTTYTVDAKAIEARHKTGALKLAWRNVAKVDRTRHAFGGIITIGIRVGRFALKLAARTDGRVESFDWAPRVPEYLTLRGGGHQIRVRLHRLERPDELLAWVEFYERVGRRATGSGPLRKTGGPSGRLAPLPALAQPADAPATPTTPNIPTTLGAPSARSFDDQPQAMYADLTPAPTDLTGSSGPLDPWGAGREGELDIIQGATAFAEQTPGEDNWLRAAPPHRPSMPPALHLPEDQPVPPYQPLPPMEPFPPMDEREQSYSGLDIFASQPALDAMPPASAAFQDHAPLTAPRGPKPAGASAGPTREPDPSSDASHYVPSPASERSGWPFQHPSESWQQPEPTSPWQPAPTPTVAEPPAPPESWFADDVEPGAAEDTPTDAIEGLADAFAPWRQDASWQPPQLPRYGPPPQDTQRDE